MKEYKRRVTDMVGWRKALVGLTLVYVFASLIMYGCGTGRQPKPTQINSRGAVQGIGSAFGKVVSQGFGETGGRGFVSRLRHLSRQATCPSVTSNWDGTGTPPDPLIVTVDYGDGCRDEFGDFMAGSFEMSISNLQIDEEGDLIGATVTVKFNNFSVEGETISGTLAIEIVNELTANVSFDLDSQKGGCREHQTFQGTIDFSADETLFTVTGSGTLSASYLGNLQVNYTATNLRFVEDCNFPVGGSLRATYNGTTEEWKFSATCGVGTVSVNGGVPQQVNLEELPSCG